MKTIEESAKEYASQINSTIDSVKLNAKDDFKAGVEFAQRWIDVNEELPYNGKIVLLMIENCNIDVVVGYYENKNFIARLYIPTGKPNFTINDKVTHWRPIELS